MVPTPSPRPLVAELVAALQHDGERPTLVTPGRDGAADRIVTAAELLREAALFADGLRALGLKSGENVLLLSENRDRWFFADLALLALGCPDVPRGADAPPDEIGYIVAKVRARVALVERPELLKRVLALPHALETVVLLSGTPPDSPAGIEILGYAAVCARADAAEAPERFAAAVAARRPDEIATIVFTSGTTGRPKGVVLTHANLASNLVQVLALIDFLPAGGTFLSILPPWHMFERMVEYALVSLGLQLVYSDRRHFGKDLGQTTPEVLAAVPRLWILLKDGVLAKIATAPPHRRLLARAALALATRRARRRRFEGGGSSLGDLLLAPLHALLRRIVLRPIARALGVQDLAGGLAISGGGTLPDHVDLFFASLGVELVNGYGLTETAPVLSLRPPQCNRGGTVGPPLPQTEFQIRDVESSRPLAAGAKGVIHARGPQVMSGYFEDAAATGAVLGPDGWFNTGDLGWIRPDGDLVIAGREKDTIVLLSGENVEPEPLENALTSSPLIEQAVVVGQDQKFLGALIVPRKQDGAGAAGPQELAAALRREIDERVSPRRGFRAHERIVRFRLLGEPLTVENGLLSQTMKVKRGAVHERLGGEIARLFADHGARGTD